MLPQRINSEELYVAWMINNEAKKFIKNIKEKTKKDIISFEEKNDFVYKKIDIQNIYDLNIDKKIKIIPVSTKDDVFFPYKLLKEEEKIYIPFKKKKKYIIKNKEDFVDYFGENEVKAASVYTINSKSLLCKALSLDKQATYDEILKELPLELRNLLRVKYHSSINFKRNKIKWGEIEDIANKNKKLYNFFEQAHKLSNEEMTLSEAISFIKELASFITTGKIYLFDKQDRGFDPELFGETTRGGFAYDREKLKKEIEKEENRDIFAYVSAEPKVNSNIKTLFKAYGEGSESGIEITKDIDIMESVIKRNEDIPNFLESIPEKFYNEEKVKETIDYSSYIKTKR